jgi:hypothetical protein
LLDRKEFDKRLTAGEIHSNTPSMPSKQRNDNGRVDDYVSDSIASEQFTVVGVSYFESCSLSGTA